MVCRFATGTLPSNLKYITDGSKVLQMSRKHSCYQRIATSTKWCRVTRFTFDSQPRIRIQILKLYYQFPTNPQNSDIWHSDALVNPKLRSRSRHRFRRDKAGNRNSLTRMFDSPFRFQRVPVFSMQNSPDNCHFGARDGETMTGYYSNFQSEPRWIPLLLTTYAAGKPQPEYSVNECEVWWRNANGGQWSFIIKFIGTVTTVHCVTMLHTND